MPDPGDDARESPPLNSSAIAYQCPKCGQTVEVVLCPVPRMVECPACEEQLLIPSETGETELPDDREEPDERDERQAAELDGQRMRHMIVARRTAIRSRTHNIVAAACCVIGAIKLVLMTIEEVRVVGWHLRQVSFVAFAVAALLGLSHFVRRAAYWGQQTRSMTLPEPETSPDFTQLSDGSQHVRNLEDLHR